MDLPEGWIWAPEDDWWLVRMREHGKAPDRMMLQPKLGYRLYLDPERNEYIIKPGESAGHPIPLDALRVAIEKVVANALLGIEYLADLIREHAVWVTDPIDASGRSDQIDIEKTAEAIRVAVETRESQPATTKQTKPDAPHKVLGLLLQARANLGNCLDMLDTMLKSKEPTAKIDVKAILHRINGSLAPTLKMLKRLLPECGDRVEDKIVTATPEDVAVCFVNLRHKVKQAYDGLFKLLNEEGRSADADKRLLHVYEDTWRAKLYVSALKGNEHG